MKQKGIKRLKRQNGEPDNSVEGIIRQVQKLRTKEQTDPVKAEIRRLIKLVLKKPKHNE